MPFFCFIKTKNGTLKVFEGLEIKPLLRPSHLWGGGVATASDGGVKSFKMNVLKEEEEQATLRIKFVKTNFEAKRLSSDEK